MAMAMGIVNFIYFRTSRPGQASNLSFTILRTEAFRHSHIVKKKKKPESCISRVDGKYNCMINETSSNQGSLEDH